MGDVTSEQSASNLLCSILRVDQLGGDAASLVVRAEDWPALVQAALRENFGAMLYLAGRRRDLLANAPKDAANQLRMAYALSLQRGTAQRLALAEILATFAAACLRIVVMKGAALSALLYQDPALRTMADIDLLAERDSLEAVHEALGALGYRRVQKIDDPHFSWSGSIEVGYVRESPSRQVLDLHWDVLVPSFGASAHTHLFWSHVRSVTIGGEPALVFTHEVMFLHLAIHHFLHHIDNALKRTFDAALLVHHHGAEMNWPLVCTLAEEMGMGQMVERMLQEVEITWGVPTSAGLAAFAAQNGVDQPRPQRVNIEVLHSPIRHLSIGATMPTLRRGVEYLVRQIFPRPNYMRQRYGMRQNWQLPFYYMLRFGRGVQQLGGYLLRRLT
jgi:hypothetical protein